jgi:hypothetical protein
VLGKSQATQSPAGTTDNTVRKHEFPLETKEKKEKNPYPYGRLGFIRRGPKTPNRNQGNHPTTLAYIRHGDDLVNKIPIISPKKIVRPAP